MKAAVPTNDGLMIASSFEEAKGFLILNIEMGKVTGEELVWNQVAYDKKAPQVYLSALKDCSAVLSLPVNGDLKTTMLSQGISMISSNERIIHNAIVNYLEHEVSRAADYCCCP